MLRRVAHTHTHTHTQTRMVLYSSYSSSRLLFCNQVRRDDINPAAASDVATIDRYSSTVSSALLSVDNRHSRRHQDQNHQGRRGGGRVMLRTSSCSASMIGAGTSTRVGSCTTTRQHTFQSQPTLTLKYWLKLDLANYSFCSHAHTRARAPLQLSSSWQS